MLWFNLSMCNTWVFNASRDQKRARTSSTGTRITHGYEPLCACCKLKTSPLEEQITTANNEKINI